MSSVRLIETILAHKKTLEDTCITSEILESVLTELEELEVDRSILAKTKIGVVVAKHRNNANKEVSEKAKKLVDTWKAAINNVAATKPGRTPPSPAPNSSPCSTLQFSGPNTGDVKRDKAREILFKAFVEGLPPEQLAEIDVSTAGHLAASIEDSLHAHFFETTNPPNSKGYQAQLRSIKSNLADKKNPDFNIRLYIGAIPMEKMATLPSIEMASDAKKAERQKAEKDALEACQSDWDLRNVKRMPGQFPCGKCKSNNTTYFQMQTRSSDEPMTTFVNCLNCGHRWKF